MELLKAHLSALLGICKLHIQISSVHMCVVPGPLRRMQFSNAYTLRRVYHVYIVKVSLHNSRVSRHTSKEAFTAPNLASTAPG
jgi:hypothetical protein